MYNVRAFCKKRSTSSARTSSKPVHISSVVLIRMEASMISFSTSEIVLYFVFQLLIIPTVHRRDVAFTLPQLSSLLSSASLLSIGSSEPRARLHLDLRARWQKWERNNLNIFVFRIKDPDLLAARTGTSGGRRKRRNIRDYRWDCEEAQHQPDQE